MVKDFLFPPFSYYKLWIFCQDCRHANVYRNRLYFFFLSWLKKYISVKESWRKYLLWLQNKIINAILASCSIYVLSWLTDIIFAAICYFPRKGNPALEKRDNTFPRTTNSFQIIMVIGVFQNVILKMGLSTFHYKKLSRTVWVENTIQKIIF